MLFSSFTWINNEKGCICRGRIHETQPIIYIQIVRNFVYHHMIGFNRLTSFDEHDPNEVALLIKIHLIFNYRNLW